MQPYIHWFRRDLRLRDNPALLAALRASNGHVIPVFVLEDAILRAPTTGAARVAFMLDALRALDHDLRQRGSRLVIRRGVALDALRDLAEQVGAAGLCFNRDYTPFAVARDGAVERALTARGIAVRAFKDAVIFEQDEVLTKSGTPYTVYTPYSRRWRACLEVEPPPPEEPLPDFAPMPKTIESIGLPSAADLGLAVAQPLPAGGEAAGLARLAEFARLNIANGIDDYQTGRDQPALAGTSRLSPYLRLGCVAPIACLRAALSRIAECRLQIADSREPEQAAIRNRQSAIETWISELAWRDFYYQIVAHFPHVLRGAFRREFDAIAWENNQEWFDAWRDGRTGYPIVDAAMRQLKAEAWMHNRARMIVASFLTKDLLIDWRWGERHFMQHLVDGDPASNNGGWQWAAGTGTDAQPFFRIFNPTSQGQKFDPRGAYVRRYVPELARVPERYIHTPWAMPADDQRRAGISLGRDYPLPIVDHAMQRERALALYRSATSP